MSNTTRLVYAILEFLENEINTAAVSQEDAESLEVAKQCLESAYAVSLDNTHLSTGRPLIDTFCEGSGLSEVSSGTTIGLTLGTTPGEEAEVEAAPAPPAAAAEATAAAAAAPPAPEPVVMATEEDKRKAEEVKNEGENDFMKQNRFVEAAEAYSKAIALDSSNPIYFSNRAAAYNKTNEYQAAVEDCQRALRLDPDYSKAYGRLGLAYTGLKELIMAKEAYQRACSLDPDNDSYQTNLRIAEQKLQDTNLHREIPSVPRGLVSIATLWHYLKIKDVNRHELGNGASTGPGFNLGNVAPGIGGFDLSSLMSNPALMNMASTMLQNPNMQQMMQSMMGQMQGNSAGGNTGEGSAAMGNLLQMGQQLASQIQTENPELVDQVRQMTQNPNSYDGDNNNQPPPPPDAPPPDAPPPDGNDS